MSDETSEKTGASGASLDPEDWGAFRALSHQAVDDMIDYLSTVRERAVWQSPSQEARAALSQPLPHGGTEIQKIYSQVKEHILPYPTGNIHPRFWGWVMGGGTPAGLLADLVISAMNCHVSGCDQAASLVEKQTLAWLVEMLGYPASASGLLVSGGTVANLIGIAVPRNTVPGRHVRREGLAEGSRLAIYASEATHGWLDRSCDLLGLGEEAFRRIRVDERDRVDIRAMRQAIQADRSQGFAPLCIVGTAGTVATGATDDLNALADLAAAEKLWLHIDGAFGALVKLSPKYRHMVEGMERADSIAFDLHKWGYMQYETGVVLIRDAVAHKEAFSFAPSYLESFPGGIGVEATEFASRGLQLSRGFRALRVWMNLATYGTDRIGAAIEQNIEDAQYLRCLIEKSPELEILGPAEMNVVCFRHKIPEMSEAELDEHNKELLVGVQESGIAVPSSARIRGKFAIRVAHTNHRTVRADFDILLQAILETGKSLAASAR